MAFDIGQHHLDWLAQGPDPKVAVLVVGATLALLGARIYKAAVVLPGFAIGVLAVLAATERFAPGVTSPLGLFLAAVALGIVGGAICWFLERIAVMAAGALLAGGLAHALAPLVMGAVTPWYVPVAASLLGLLLFPRLYRALLPVVTPIIGALCIAWALDRPDDLVLIGGVSAVGMIVQIAWSGGGKTKKKGKD